MAYIKPQSLQGNKIRQQLMTAVRNFTDLQVTDAKAAEAFNISPQFLSSLLNGHKRVTVEKLFQMCENVGISVTLKVGA